MSREDVLTVVERLLAAARRHDLPQMLELYAPDAVAVSPVFGTVTGREAIVASWETLFTTFSDAAVDISDVLVDGDRVAVLSSLRTTDRLGLFGRPATGGQISYRLVLLFTVGGGKVVRDERIYDSAGVAERLEKARLDKELQTAASVQRALSPRTAHLGPFCQSIGDSVPCRAIGGDFFEFFDLPTGDAGIVLGDVSGKGPSAALLAAMVQGMFAVDAPTGDGPGTILSRVNRRLAGRRLESRFSTLVYGVLSADGSLVYSNAGHNPPMLIERDGIRRLTTGGPILGAFDAARFDQERVLLRTGNTLVMFTDGVTEARDGNGEEFGDERLLACVQANAARSPGQLLEAVFGAVRTFSAGADPTDDVTVTITRFGPG